MDVELLRAQPSASPCSSSSYTTSNASTPSRPPRLSSPSDAYSTAAAAPMSSNGPTSGDGGIRGRGRRGSVVPEAAGRLVSVLFTCAFAIAGFLVGAVTGGLRGLATENGLFRGAGIGAVSGAVFSIEVVESSSLIRCSGGSGMWSILYVIETITSLLSGRLVREKVGPAVQNAVQRQISAVDAPFREALDIFETGGTSGMSMASVDTIPKLRVTAENGVDASGERIRCAVCLRDLQPSEMARRLPYCRHMFHLPCIDCWLLRQASCPLCRRDF